MEGHGTRGRGGTRACHFDEALPEGRVYGNVAAPPVASPGCKPGDLASVRLRLCLQLLAKDHSLHGLHGSLSGRGVSRTGCLPTRLQDTPKTTTRKLLRHRVFRIVLQPPSTLPAASKGGRQLLIPLPGAAESQASLPRLPLQASLPRQRERARAPRWPSMRPRAPVRPRPGPFSRGPQSEPFATQQRHNQLRFVAQGIRPPVVPTSCRPRGRFSPPRAVGAAGETPGKGRIGSRWAAASPLPTWVSSSSPSLTAPCSIAALLLPPPFTQKPDAHTPLAPTMAPDPPALMIRDQARSQIRSAEPHASASFPVLSSLCLVPNPPAPGACLFCFLCIPPPSPPFSMEHFPSQ